MTTEKDNEITVLFTEWLRTYEVPHHITQVPMLQKTFRAGVLAAEKLSKGGKDENNNH